MEPAEVVDRQVDAFNRHDIDAFCAGYRDDVIVRAVDGTARWDGIERFRSEYAEQFDHFPDLVVRVTGRLELGSWLVDRETMSVDGVERTGGAAYRIVDGRIAEVLLFPIE